MDEIRSHADIMKYLFVFRPEVKWIPMSVNALPQNHTIISPGAINQQSLQQFQTSLSASNEFESEHFSKFSIIKTMPLECS